MKAYYANRARHKFGAKRTEADGIRFDSKLEAKYYAILKILRDNTKEVLFFLRQVPLHLPGGTKLVIDFQVFWADGTVTFEDVKGMETDAFKIKKREVEAQYPIEIKIITKKDMPKLA